MSAKERKSVPYRDKTLLFDFDGTLSLGVGPVVAYARAAAQQLPVDEAHAFVETVVATLDEHPSGRAPGTSAIDGYDLVRLMSADHGIRPETLGEAYLASRAHLGSPLAPVVAPDDLAEFLSEARQHANLVVATNAPDIRISEALEVLGLAGLFDAVYTSLGKPNGMAAVLDDWLPRGQVLSIGDVWINDLAPAHARGALTALVGSTSDETPDVTPTFSAHHLHDLYPAITEWLRTSSSSPFSPAPSER
ncbi:HAD family hydrolase [Agreia bicolorata]|uniref:HAD family hydrolase n=1 Tax=Agreia bicolorata TaxID=110935 RepID=UPI001EE71560|nr:HAD family hydrolase [Agreia bicolorata]